MDRGIKDEAFVRRALQEADFDMGRWIANQACFNNAATSPINEVARAAVVTAVAIYNQKYGEVITEQDLIAAQGIKTVGDARQLIDSVSARLPKFEGWRPKKDTHFNCLNKQHSLNSCP